MKMYLIKKCSLNQTGLSSNDLVTVKEFFCCPVRRTVTVSPKSKTPTQAMPGFLSRGGVKTLVNPESSVQITSQKDNCSLHMFMWSVFILEVFLWLIGVCVFCVWLWFECCLCS